MTREPLEKPSGGRPDRPPASPPERVTSPVPTPTVAHPTTIETLGDVELDDDGYPVEESVQVDDGRVMIKRANQISYVEPEMFEGVAYVELSYPLYGTDARRPISRVWRRVSDGKKFYEGNSAVRSMRLPIHPMFR